MSDLYEKLTSYLEDICKNFENFKIENGVTLKGKNDIRIKSYNYLVYSSHEMFPAVDIWVRLPKEDLYLSNFYKEKGSFFIEEKGFFIFKLDIFSGLVSMLNPYYKGYNNEGIYPVECNILDLKEIKNFQKFQKFLIEEDKNNYMKTEKRNETNPQKKKTTKKASLYTRTISKQLIRTGIEKILSNKKQDIDTVIEKDVYYLLDSLFPENSDQAFCNIIDKTADEFDNILEFHLWREYTYGIKHKEIQLEVFDNGEMLYQFIINKDGSCYMGVENKALLKELKDLNLNITKIFINKN